MESIAEKLTHQLVLSGKVEQNKSDIIQYGLELSISTLFIMISIIFLSVLVFDKFDGIIFTLFFSSVRLFSGGLHAPTYAKCFVLSLSVFCFAAVGTDMFPISGMWINILIMLFCYGCIYIRTPRINHNHLISETTALKCRMRVKKVMLMNLLITLFLSLLGNHYSTMAVYSTMIMTVLFFLPEKGKEWIGR